MVQLLASTQRKSGFILTGGQGWQLHYSSGDVLRCQQVSEARGDEQISLCSGFKW